MSNSVDPDEPSHLALRCLQTPIIIAYGSERVKETLPRLGIVNLFVPTRRVVKNSIDIQK